jgi:hypothetical protein
MVMLITVPLFSFFSCLLPQKQKIVENIRLSGANNPFFRSRIHMETKVINMAF